MVDAIAVNLFTRVAGGVPAAGRPELRSGVRLLARLGQRRGHVDVGFTQNVLPSLVVYDG